LLLSLRRKCETEFKCLPASVDMVSLIGRQFKKEHLWCEKRDTGEFLKAANGAKHKAFMGEDRETVDGDHIKGHRRRDTKGVG